MWKNSFFTFSLKLLKLASIAEFNKYVLCWLFWNKWSLRYITFQLIAFSNTFGFLPILWYLIWNTTLMVIITFLWREKLYFILYIRIDLIVFRLVVRFSKAHVVRLGQVVGPVLAPKVTQDPTWTSDKICSLTACKPIGQRPVRTSTIAARWTLLKASSWEDFLRSTLGLKDFAVAQILVVDQRLTTLREVYKYRARVQDDNGVSPCSQSDEFGLRLFSLASSSTLQFPAILL